MERYLFLEEELAGSGMPVLERAVRMGGHECVPQILLVGIVGQAGDWRVVRPHQYVLHVL